MAALQLSSLYHFDLLYGDEMAFDRRGTRGGGRGRRGVLQGRLGHTTVCHLEEAPSRSDENASPRRPVWASLPRGGGVGGAEEKLGEGVAGETENEEENTTPPDNSLAHESQTMRQRGNGDAAAFRAILAHFLYILYANQSLCLPSLIKQLYY